MSQIAKLVAIGVIILSLGLCMVFGSVGLYIALAERSRAAVWEPVLAEKDRLRQQMQDDLQMLQTRHKGNVPSQERMAFIRRTTELDMRIEQMMFTNPQLRGKVPAAIGKKLGQPLMAEAMLALTSTPEPESPQEKARRIARAEQRRQADEMIDRINRSGEREAERQAVAAQGMVMQKAEADRIWSEIEAYYRVPGEPGTRRPLSNKQEAIIGKMRTIETGLRTTYHPGDRFDVVLQDYRKLQQQMDEIERENEKLRRLAEESAIQQKLRELRDAELRKQQPERGGVAGTGIPTGAYTMDRNGNLIPLASSGPGRPVLPPPADVPPDMPPTPPQVASDEQPATTENPTPPREIPTPEPTPSVEPMQPAEALPGFAVEQMSQLQAGVKILVKSKDKWLPATIQAKRNKLFDIRYATGDLAVVTAERIRLQEDPAK